MRRIRTLERKLASLPAPSARTTGALVLVTVGGAAGVTVLGPPAGAADLMSRILRDPVFLISGLAIWRFRPGSVSGPLLVGVGAWGQAVQLLEATALPLPFTIGLSFGEWESPFLIWAILAFPEGRMTRAAWTLVGVRAINVIFIRPIDHVFFEPARWGCTSCEPGINLLMIRDDPDLTILLDDISIGLYAIELLALAALLGWRLWRATPPARRVLAPIALPAIVMSLGTVVRFAQVVAADIEGTKVWAPGFVDRIQWISAATTLWLPVGILIGSHLQARRLDRVGQVPGGLSLVEQLRHILGDESVALISGPGEPTLAEGRAASPLFYDGVRVGTLIHDPAAADDRRLISAVTATAALALANHSLVADLKRHLEQAEASRARLVMVESEARREIERELSTGANAHLGAALTAIADARAHAPDSLAGPLGDLQRTLEESVKEVEQLVRGLTPPVLAERGFAAAIQELADQSPAPARVVALPEIDLDPVLGAAGWFVVSEALSNAAKHANPDSVRISVTIDEDRLKIEVADDGIGGADPERGGLKGLAERVDALHGTLTVHSPPGLGTSLIAEFPMSPKDGDVADGTAPAAHYPAPSK